MVTPCLSAKSHQLSATRQVGVGSSSKQDPLGEAPGSPTQPLNHLSSLRPVTNGSQGSHFSGIIVPLKVLLLVNLLEVRSSLGRQGNVKLQQKLSLVQMPPVPSGCCFRYPNALDSFPPSPAHSETYDSFFFHYTHTHSQSSAPRKKKSRRGGKVEPGFRYLQRVACSEERVAAGDTRAASASGLLERQQAKSLSHRVLREKRSHQEIT